MLVPRGELGEGGEGQDKAVLVPRGELGFASVCGDDLSCSLPCLEGVCCCVQKYLVSVPLWACLMCQALVASI